MSIYFFSKCLKGPAWGPPAEGHTRPPQSPSLEVAQECRVTNVQHIRWEAEASPWVRVLGHLQDVA